MTFQLFAERVYLHISLFKILNLFAMKKKCNYLLATVTVTTCTAVQ